jgi:hypothetical protein
MMSRELAISSLREHRAGIDDYDAALHRRCAACAYDLRGLPRAGICPECGGGYNPQTMVLYGWPGRTRNPVARNLDHARKGLMIWSVLGISICGALLFDQETEQAMTLGMIFAPIIAAYWALAALEPYHPGPARAHISPDGIGQRDPMGMLRIIRWSRHHAIRITRQAEDELRVKIHHVIFGIPWTTPVDIVIKTSLPPEELQRKIESLR